jgi:hypothetical protein
MMCAKSRELSLPGAKMGAENPMHKPIMPRSTIAALIFALCMPAFAQQAAPIQVKENAPDRYIVEKGDTLWGISGKFLKEPWRWTEIWKLNQDQIKNPNRIYPGDVIVLDRSGGEAQLRLANAGETVRLLPRVRGEVIGAAIPSIPALAIEPFLSKPLVIEQDGLDRAPRVISTGLTNVYLGAGDAAYVSGIGDSKASTWLLYRPGKALVDPETNKTLGYEAVYLGTGIIEKPGEPAVLRITTATQEIGLGTRLVAAGAPAANDYLPHPPKTAVNGRVLGVYGGLTTAGRNSIIILNRGARDGIDNGAVLALYRLGETVVEKAPELGGERVVATVKLPDVRYGLVFVFRTFDQVSYALVMESSRTVNTNDVVQSP